MRVLQPLCIAAAFGMAASLVGAAGPETTAKLLAAAKETRGRPHAERVTAYRAVVRARKRLDVNAFRALRAMAGLYKAAKAPHDRAAVTAWAVVHHPKNERGTYLARMRLARLLRSEGDLAAAHRIYRSVVADGHRVARDAASRALADLGADALDARAENDVRWCLKTARRLKVDALTQMKLEGAAGVMALERGNRRLAVRHQLRCWRLFQETQDHVDPKVVRKAAKVWLDLPLRKALDD